MILVDEPLWPGRGRLWSHLVSDVSFDELHVFASMLGVPPRAFDRDHYDIPEGRFPSAVWLGAVLLPSRELAARLRVAGLRRPKHLNRTVSPAPEPGSPVPSPPTPRAAARDGRSTAAPAAP